MTNGSGDEEEGRRRIDRLLAEALEQQVAEQRELAQVIGRVDEALAELREGMHELTARVEGAVQPLAAFVLERLAELLDAPAPPSGPVHGDADERSPGLDAVRADVHELASNLGAEAQASRTALEAAVEGVRAQLDVTVEEVAQRVGEVADAASSRLAADGQRAAEHVADTADAAATRLEGVAGELSMRVDSAGADLATIAGGLQRLDGFEDRVADVIERAAAATREVAEEAVGAIRMVAEDTVAAARAVVEDPAGTRDRPEV